MRKPSPGQEQQRLFSGFGALPVAAFVTVGAAANLLALNGSLFMLQVYDRVLPSRSVPTLVGLALLAALLYAFHGVLDGLRGRVMLALSGIVENRLAPRLFAAMLRLPADARSETGNEPLRDLDQLRSFLAGPGPGAFFDLPFVPLFLAVCFLFHLWIGVTALAGTLVLIVLALLTEVLSRRRAGAVAAATAERERLAEVGRGHAEVMAAMGFAERHVARFAAAGARLAEAQQRASAVVGALAGLSRVTRMTLQSALLAVGAYLAIEGEVSAGAMVASSIMMTRALAPVEVAIGQWKGFAAARQGMGRIRRLLAGLPEEAPRTALPPPARELAVEGLMVAAPGERTPILRGVSFRAEAGAAIGVIGASASGKSTLARALVGAWPPLKGGVRLDGATLDQWSAAARGAHIGFLPQEIALIEGTIAENIARFEPSPDPAAIVAAAREAGCHEMILRLEKGYETELGDGGAPLSGGQRQRVALARALYREPFLVVLDEPNAHLDGEGEAALARAIQGVRARGGIAVVIAHRPSALAAVDRVIVMNAGQIQADGPNAEVLRRLKPRGAAQLRPVAEQGA